MAHDLRKTRSVFCCQCVSVMSNTSAVSVVADTFQPCATPDVLEQTLQERHDFVVRTGGCALSLITTRAAFDALESDWNDLFARCGKGVSVFQSFNWLWHWCNHFLEEDRTGLARTRLAILTGRREGRLIMAWPLAMETVGSVRKLVWMGDPVGQYGDALIEESGDKIQLLDEAWRFLQTNCQADVIRLRKVRADASVAPLLARSRAMVSEALTAPYLNLFSAPTYAAYEQRYTAKVRRNRRRLRRRLEERAPVRFETHAPGIEAAALTKQALSLKRDWLKRRGMVSPALADPRVDSFFCAVAADERQDTGLRVSVLKSGETAAAIEIAFRNGRYQAGHLIVYDGRFEKSGAGVILMENSIRRLHAEGVVIFDLLAPGDAYKMDWADDEIEVCDWALPLTLKGRAYARLYLGFMRKQLKAAMAVLPGMFQHIFSKR